MSYHKSKSICLKKCLRKISLFALVLAFVFIFSACENTERVSYVGETIDINDLFARSTEAADTEAEKATVEYTDTEKADTDDGESENERDTNLQTEVENSSAATAESESAETSSAASDSLKSSEIKNAGDTAPETDKSPNGGTVYWVDGGKVWHSTKGCSALSRSKNIISGSKSEAIAAGKERGCKKCY